MLFRMLYDDKLAQASYLIGCQRTGQALIIDPQRDVTRYIREAKLQGMRISAITETHIHADFLSGARELAEQTGAHLYLSDEGDDDWKYSWLDKKQGGGSYKHTLVKDGDSFHVGNIEIKVVHTPGHTPEHISFLVIDHGGGATEPMGIATGDFVFVGDVGRPDLLETAAGQTGAKEQSARTLYHSIRKFTDFPDYLQLWPGHGSGSACGKALGAVPQSTVGYEKRFNAAISAATSESEFVRGILHGQPEPPLYFARMKKENKEGPAILGKIPEPEQISLSTLEQLLLEDIYLLDTRPWQEFIAGHLPAALHVPLNKAFPTIAGSYVEPGKPIYLVVEAARVSEAVTDLIRIGLDDIRGFATPESLQDGKLQKSKHLPMQELRDLVARDHALILDVRHAHEYEAGHLPNATNIAHTRLATYIQQLPKDRTVYVYCHTGSRSRYATALLERNGFDAVHLDGGYVTWQQDRSDVSK